jgi:hypothetical protein
MQEETKPRSVLGENLKESKNSWDLDVDDEIIFKKKNCLKEWGDWFCTWFISLRMGIYIMNMTMGTQVTQNNGISCLFEVLLAFQARLSSVESVQ